MNKINKIKIEDEWEIDELEEMYYEAVELMGQGKIKKAKKIFEEIVAEDNKNIDAYLGLAIANKLLNNEENYHKNIDNAFKITKEKFKKWPEELTWGYLDNRPYLRSIAMKAESFWNLNKEKETIELYKLLLKLSPNDNQGIRYLLAALYAGIDGDDVNYLTDKGNELQDWSTLEKLLKKQNDIYHFWGYNK